MLKFKGVEIKQQTTGGALYVRFRDPRTSPKRQVYKSTESNDMGTAERIAGELSGLIYGPPEHWHKLPSGLHIITEKIWNPMDKTVDSMTDDHAVTLIFQALKNGPTGNHEQFMQARQRVLDLMNRVLEIPALIQERDALKNENMLLKAERKRMGLRAVKDGARKSIASAVDDFFKSGACGATSDWRNALRGWFDRLSNELGPNTNVMDITPEMIANHINSLRKQAKKGTVGKPLGADTKRRIRINLNTFLRHATNGNFDGDQLIALTKGLSAQARMETNTEWFWLKPEECKSLIANISDQYWRDAALCQWQLGLRAEEIALLQTKNVDFDKNTIHITRIFDGKTLVRRLKTDQSEEYVQLNKAVKEALERRIAAKNFLLFPCYDPKTLLEPRFQTGLTAFETKYQLWPVPAMGVVDGESSGDGYTFTTYYRKVLRLAAKGVLEDVKKMDSRTLRRTCARELVLKYGCDRASSVLRDDVETIKRHYGNLMPSDTSTER